MSSIMYNLGMILHMLRLDFAAWMFRRRGMVYAADARCVCGLGMAYRATPLWVDLVSYLVPNPILAPFRRKLHTYRPSAWDCSGILLGTADVNVKHEDILPFAFWKVMSENSASAQGATTRPEATR